MHLPADWALINGGKISRMPVCQVRFASLAASLNYIGKTFMEYGFEWLFLTNDDHVYPPDTILRLLSHNKDYVTGVYLKKQIPFDPILYESIDENGRLVPKLFKRFEGGLVPIVASGDGCLLIRRKVLETIPYPWWEMSDPASPDLITQDLIFSKKVRDAGFEMYADLDAVVGHLAITLVSPERTDADWKTVILTGQSDRITLPPAPWRQEQKNG